MPDQSTLWRSWHKRFSAELRSTVETAARTIPIKAQNTGVAIPCEPERQLPSYGDEADKSDPADQALLDEAAPITDHVSRVVFPVFSLDRGEGCEIHENAYWDLQTYLVARGWLRTKELAVSSTNRRATGHRWGTPITTTFVISRLHRFGRCTDRRSINC